LNLLFRVGLHGFMWMIDNVGIWWNCGDKKSCEVSEAVRKMWK
jgi:hypothetical protein